MAGREFTLDAVDYIQWSGANGISFRLDGVTYIAVEDPDDDLRSHLKEIVACERVMANVFPSVQVRTRMMRHEERNRDDEPPEVLIVYDKTTSKTVLEIGTTYGDSLYPSFVYVFIPENMVSNIEVKKLWDAVDGKLPYMRRIRNYTKQ